MKDPLNTRLEYRITVATRYIPQILRHSATLGEEMRRIYTLQGPSTSYQSLREPEGGFRCHMETRMQILSTMQQLKDRVEKLICGGRQIAECMDSSSRPG
jgi:hypothetical protein